MFGPRLLLKAAPTLKFANRQINVGPNVFVGPPKIKMSGMQKAIHMIFMNVTIWSVPFFVLTQIESFKNRDK